MAVPPVPVSNAVTVQLCAVCTGVTSKLPPLSVRSDRLWNSTTYSPSETAVTDGVPPWESYTLPPGAVSMYPDSAATVAVGAAGRAGLAIAGPVTAAPAASRVSPARLAAAILSLICAPLTPALDRALAPVQKAFHPVPARYKHPYSPLVSPLELLAGQRFQVRK